MDAKMVSSKEGCTEFGPGTKLLVADLGGNVFIIIRCHLNNVTKGSSFSDQTVFSVIGVFFVVFKHSLKATSFTSCVKDWSINFGKDKTNLFKRGSDSSLATG